MIITYTLVHIVHTDSLHHFLYEDIQQLKHLGHLCTVNYKFSSKHHEPYEPDETIPENNNNNNKSSTTVVIICEFFQCI